MTTQTVFTATQTTNNVAIEEMVDGFIDEAPIKADEIPRFQVRVPNTSGIEGHRLAVGKQLNIYRSGELRFPGIITYTNPEADAQGRYCLVRGIHRGYNLLRARQCDSYDFDEDGLSVTTRDAVTVNPWHYFVHRKAGGTLDIYGQAQPIDGVRPDEIVECLAGTKFISQHSFEDNSFLLASQVYAGPTVGAASPDDATSANRDFTEVGSPGSRNGNQSKYGTGYDLSGSGQYLENASTAFATLTDLSLTASFELDALPASGTYMPIVGVQNSASDTDTNFLVFIRSTGRIAYRQRNSNSDTNAVIGPGQHNLTLRRSSNSVTMFVDGVEALPATSYTAPTLSTSSKLRVGKGYHTGLSATPVELNGAIYELRVWGSAIAQATLDTVANPSSATYTETLVGTESSAWFFAATLTPNTTPQVFRDGLSGDLRPKLQRTRNGSTYNQGGSVESIPLENGDPNIDPMSLMRTATIQLIGDYDGANNPTADICFSARATTRAYHSISLVRTADYNGSGLSSWSGSVTVNPADMGNSMAWRIFIPGSSGTSTSTKVEYVKLTAECDTSLGAPDSRLTDAIVSPYVSPTIADTNSIERDWLEIDLQSFNRLEALEKVREMTEASVASSSSPHWDAWIDDDLNLRFQERRGMDITSHDYTFASGNLQKLGHEFYGEEVAYQTIAYGSGSGEAQTRIVSQEEFSSGGLFDTDRDPTGATPLYGDVARILNFVDNNEASITALLRKARAYHKLHRNPIETVSVEVGSEHLRYFETGDSIRVVDLGTRTNGLLRVVGLRRHFSGGSRERLTLSLGEPNDDFATRLADGSGKTRTATLRVQEKPTAGAGVSGTGVPFDKSRYGIWPIGVPQGTKRVLVDITTLPFQSTSKSAKPTPILTGSGASATNDEGNSAIGNNASHTYNVLLDKERNYTLQFIATPTGGPWTGTWYAHASVLNAAVVEVFADQREVTGTTSDDFPILITASIYTGKGTSNPQASLIVRNESGSTRTIGFKIVTIKETDHEHEQQFGIYQFDGDSGTGTGAPVYGQGITFAIDPADGDGDGIPTGAEFQDKRHPSTIGAAASPYTVKDIDITGYLATEANGTIKVGEHRLYFLGAAAANNEDGLACVSVVPTYLSET